MRDIQNKDTVIEAGKTCLLVGFIGSFFIIGLPFLFVSFFLGIYAMATNRLKDGTIISILSIVLAPIGALVGYVLIVILAFGFFASILGKILQ